MTQSELTTARAILRELGLLEEKQTGGTNRRLYYRLDDKKLFELMQKAASEGLPI